MIILPTIIPLKTVPLQFPLIYTINIITYFLRYLSQLGVNGMFSGVKLTFSDKNLFIITKHSIIIQNFRL